MKFIDKVEAPDATTVVFTCSKPKANMLGLWIPILPEHIWSKIKPADAEKSFKNPPPIIGSGPFQTVEWKKGAFVRLVANKNYWRGAPKVDEVIFQTYQNQDTMAQDLKTGAIQSGWNVPSAQFSTLDSQAALTGIRAVTIGFDELGFNCADKKLYPKSTGHPVLTDPAFRSALQWAVDKAKIVAIGYNGNAAPADTIITRDYYSKAADYHWTPPAGDPNTYTFDLEKATTAPSATSSTTTTATSMPRTSTCSSGAGAATSTRTTSSRSSRRAPSRPGATASGRTQSTTSCSSSSSRPSTCRSASRSSSRCSRSSTRTRRTSRWSTPSTSRWPTPPTGPAGGAPTRTRARGGTTPSRTPTWPCRRAPRSRRPPARTPA